MHYKPLSEYLLAISFLTQQQHESLAICWRGTKKSNREISKQQQFVTRGNQKNIVVAQSINLEIWIHNQNPSTSYNSERQEQEQ